jgi:ADP-heptose:LPS heptosyltransferase
VKNILIYNSGGGLGDSIQLMPLLLSLKNHFKTGKFFYLGAHTNHFDGRLKEYKIDIKTFDLNLEYFGFRWWHILFVKKKFKQKNIQKFDLIIDIQSKLRNTLILKMIPHHLFYSKTFNSLFCSKKIKFSSDNDLENLNVFLNEKIKKREFKDTRLSSQLRNEAKKLLPNSNYVGFSITQGNEYRKKSWSIYKFISLANKISINNKVPVFFIEKSKTELMDKIKNQVPSAIFPEAHSKFSCPALVTALASRLSMAISIDNGIMHMMGLAKIPMIVLFGPTNSKKFAPKNSYTKILDSKKLYNSSDINMITVDDVLEKI